MNVWVLIKTEAREDNIRGVFSCREYAELVVKVLNDFNDDSTVNFRIENHQIDGTTFDYRGK